jgi:hypothetical protein
MVATEGVLATEGTPATAVYSMSTVEYQGSISVQFEYIHFT